MPDAPTDLFDGSRRLLRHIVGNSPAGAWIEDTTQDEQTHSRRVIEMARAVLAELPATQRLVVRLAYGVGQPPMEVEQITQTINQHAARTGILAGAMSRDDVIGAGQRAEQRLQSEQMRQAVTQWIRDASKEPR